MILIILYLRAGDHTELRETLVRMCSTWISNSRDITSSALFLFRFLQEVWLSEPLTIFRVLKARDLMFTLSSQEKES